MGPEARNMEEVPVFRGEAIEGEVPTIPRQAESAETEGALQKEVVEIEELFRREADRLQRELQENVATLRGKLLPEEITKETEAVFFDRYNEDIARLTEKKDAAIRVEEEKYRKTSENLS